MPSQSAAIESTPHFFVDIQNNGVTLPKLDGGYQVIDLSSRGLTKADFLAFMEHSFQMGIIPCPTMITAPKDVMLANLTTIADGLDELGIQGPWIHCEGPFFSGKEGAIGAHPPEHVQPADISLLNQMIEASRGRIAMLTVGADVPRIVDLIQAAVERSIKVSLGHHIPNAKQLLEAVTAGATMVTHQWNGVPRQVERQGFLWDQLANPNLRLGVITDGVHVTDACIQLALEVKGPQGVVVVSDRSPLGGHPVAENLNLWGSKVSVRGVKVDGEPTSMVVGSNGLFAGAYANMLECMNHAAYLRMLWNNLPDTGLGVPRLSVPNLWQVGLWGPLDAMGKNLSDFGSISDRVAPVHIDLETEKFTVATRF